MNKMNNNKKKNNSKVISASILSADFGCLGEEIKKVIKAGADWIHLDVMDGLFVPNLTFGPPIINSLRKYTNKTFDVHLMIKNPEKHILSYIEAGADILTFHIEATQNPLYVIKTIKKHKKRVGITLKPKTPINKILPYIKLVDLILVMTVEPGFSGQSFLEKQTDKVKKLKNYIKKNKGSQLIEIDGGINNKTAKKCHHADVLVSASYIFKSKDYAQRIKNLKN